MAAAMELEGRGKFTSRRSVYRSGGPSRGQNCLLKLWLPILPCFTSSPYSWKPYICYITGIFMLHVEKRRYYHRRQKGIHKPGQKEHHTLTRFASLHRRCRKPSWHIHTLIGNRYIVFSRLSRHGGSITGPSWRWLWRKFLVYSRQTRREIWILPSGHVHVFIEECSSSSAEVSSSHC
jgi:hypothetical protein